MADILRPLLAAALTLVIPIPPTPPPTAILLAAVPSGFFGILFGVTYRLDSAHGLDGHGQHCLQHRADGDRHRRALSPLKRR